jgi:energy-coupling factor transporter ATP-binding protein EcfA2
MASNKSIIAFAGRNGCGKGTAAEQASALLTAPKHTYSDVLYELHVACGVPRENVGRPTLQGLSTVVREWFGQDALARVMGRKCAVVQGPHVVIDGVRRLDDTELLLQEYGEGLIPVWIETSADNRYARLKARKEKMGEQMMSREDFDLQEQAESEQQLDLVRQACKIVINNDGTPEDLQHQIEALVASIVDFGPVAHG